jgi:hypothetical protein
MLNLRRQPKLAVSSLGEDYPIQGLVYPSWEGRAIWNSASWPAMGSRPVMLKYLWGAPFLAVG